MARSGDDTWTPDTAAKSSIYHCSKSTSPRVVLQQWRQIDHCHTPSAAALVYHIANFFDCYLRLLALVAWLELPSAPSTMK